MFRKQQKLWTEKEKNEGDLEHVYIKNREYWVFDELGRLAYPIRNQGTRGTISKVANRL